MTRRELSKVYDPHQVEERWYEYWAAGGYFRPRADGRGEPYAIVIPPPNVTGSLHVGHALNNSLQDILIRWRRMQGYDTVWIPGMDHAGIATQNVVERKLAEEGSSREGLGRDAFVKRVWEWKERSGGTILRQLRRLGASCDWDRTRFTMDEGLSEAVREVFVRLYEDGLLYRGERLINWCPRCLTALSDIEVEHEETMGKLYTIRYPLARDASQHLLVATTRPETMLGDTGVAVHPEDERYRHLIGQHVRVPLTNRDIPVVGDPILVDREFGTGAVKITPAHDFNDFTAGERHGLPRLRIMDPHALLTSSLLISAGVEPQVVEVVGGLPVGKARPKIEQLLADRVLLEKVEPHRMAIGKCYRCKTVVEPLLSDQWFVAIQPLARPAIRAVEEGRIRIVPEAWRNNYLGWMHDIKDWCVSRQIWWGHQIPAWYCYSCLVKQATEEEKLILTRQRLLGKPWAIPSSAKPIVARSKPSHCPDCQGDSLIQDPDVLDTWFSSALWPFSTLGWPRQTADLMRFYPTSTLVTGLDILFFWVARMIMMGLKFMGDVPFREVYIHALVRDAEGQKMSKSKGNVIDPLHVMEKYGTDSLRFTLASMATPGRDIKLSEERIEGYRNFANKIWNAARFILMHTSETRIVDKPERRSLPDQWILTRLAETTEAVGNSLEDFRFDHACSTLYQFIWHEYCDWYLEMAKVSLQQPDSVEAQLTRRTLVESFETLMRVLHPFMPFLTEEIWQSLPHDGDSIMIKPYPVLAERPVSPTVVQGNRLAMAVLQRAVSLVRTARSLLNQPLTTPVEIHVASRTKAEEKSLQTLEPYLAALGRGRVFITNLEDWPQDRILKLASQGMTIGLTVPQDVDLQKAIDRIRRQKDEELEDGRRLKGKLANKEFLGKAPQEVVEDHQRRLVALEQNEQLLDSSLQQLRAMV